MTAECVVVSYLFLEKRYCTKSDDANEAFVARLQCNDIKGGSNRSGSLFCWTRPRDRHIGLLFMHRNTYKYCKRIRTGFIESTFSNRLCCIGQRQTDSCCERGHIINPNPTGSSWSGSIYLGNAVRIRIYRQYTVIFDHMMYMLYIIIT